MREVVWLLLTTRTATPYLTEHNLWTRLSTHHEVGFQSLRGLNWMFRTWCEGTRIGHVVAVPRSQTIPAAAGSDRADHATAGAPEQAWKRP